MGWVGVEELLRKKGVHLDPPEEGWNELPLGLAQSIEYFAFLRGIDDPELLGFF